VICPSFPLTSTPESHKLAEPGAFTGQDHTIRVRFAGICRGSPAFPANIELNGRIVPEFIRLLVNSHQRSSLSQVCEAVAAQPSGEIAFPGA
jgi:hypothetical protein